MYMIFRHRYSLTDKIFKLQTYTEAGPHTQQGTENRNFLCKLYFIFVMVLGNVYQEAGKEAYKPFFPFPVIGK